MKKNKTNDAYNRELVSLIKSGIDPVEAKRIADSHIGNYEKVVAQVEEERKADKANRQHQNAYVRILAARINGGEKPEDVVKDMEDFELQ